MRTARRLDGSPSSHPSTAPRLQERIDVGGDVHRGVEAAAAQRRAGGGTGKETEKSKAISAGEAKRAVEEDRQVAEILKALEEVRSGSKGRELRFDDFSRLVQGTSLIRNSIPP